MRKFIIAVNLYVKFTIEHVPFSGGYTQPFLSLTPLSDFTYLQYIKCNPKYFYLLNNYDF